MKHTLKDLDLLIDKHLEGENCKNYPNICQLLGTEAGRNRIKTRIKEKIFNDGLTSIEGIIAHIESEMDFAGDE